MFGLFTKKKKEAPVAEDIPAMKLIYTDDQGNKFYEFANVLEIPSRRSIAAEVAIREQQMNLTADNLNMLIEHAKTAGDKGNFSDVMTIINEIQYRLTFAGEEQTLLKLATIYFTINGENPNKYKKEDQDLKMEIFKSNDDVRDFFLQKAYNLTQIYSDTSEADILMYLKRVESQNKRLQRFLHPIT